MHDLLDHPAEQRKLAGLLVRGASPSEGETH